MVATQWCRFSFLRPALQFGVGSLLTSFSSLCSLLVEVFMNLEYLMPELLLVSPRLLGLASPRPDILVQLKET